MPRRRLRNFSIFVGLLIATGVFLLATVLESGALTPGLVRWVNARLEPALGLHVSTSAVYLRPWSGLTLHDVRVTAAGDPEADPREYVASFGEVAAGYRFLGLLGDTPRLTRLRLRAPDVDLDQLVLWSAGRADRPAAEREPRPAGAGRRGLRIDRLEVVDAMLRRDRRPVVSAVRLSGSLGTDEGAWILT
jgi:hypothetical protein